MRRTYVCFDTLMRCITRFFEPAEGTHIITMEKNRFGLFEAVQASLDEAKRP